MKVVVLGAGISGHTAAAFLKKKLGKNHDVIVVSPSKYYQWLPSNIWVGVGKMIPDQLRFDQYKVYNGWGIDFRQAKATAIHPEGATGSHTAFVDIEYTSVDKKGETDRVEYDYLVNATGPKLNFEVTESLGPGKNTVSVCSYDHAAHAWGRTEEKYRKDEKRRKATFPYRNRSSNGHLPGSGFLICVEYRFRAKTSETFAHGRYYLDFERIRSGRFWHVDSGFRGTAHKSFR